MGDSTGKDSTGSDRRPREGQIVPLPGTGRTADSGRPSDPPVDSAAVVAFIETLRASAEQELVIAGRYSSNARQAFALAAAAFAITQTVTFTGLVGQASGQPRPFLLALLALLSVFALAWAAHQALEADKPITAGDLPIEELEEELTALYDGDTEVLGRLGEFYLGVIQSRRKSNDKRLGAYTAVRRAVLTSLTLTAIQLISAILYLS